MYKVGAYKSAQKRFKRCCRVNYGTPVGCGRCVEASCLLHQPDGQGAAYPGQDVPGDGHSRLEWQPGGGTAQYSGGGASVDTIGS